MPQKTRAQLTTELVGLLVGNTSGNITAPLHKSLVQNLVDSMPTFQDGEVQGGLELVVLAGSAGVYTANLTPTAVAYETGKSYVFVFPDNPPAASTVAFDALPAQNIFIYREGVGAANALGDLRQSGPMFITYNNGQFEITFQPAAMGGIDVIDLVGAAGVYTGTFGLLEYVENQLYFLKFPDNPPDDSTINLDLLGVKNLQVNRNGTPANNVLGDFRLNQYYGLIYKSDKFQWQYVDKDDKAAITFAHPTDPSGSGPRISSTDEGFGNPGKLVLGSSLTIFIAEKDYYKDSLPDGGTSGVWGDDFSFMIRGPFPDVRGAFVTENSGDNNTDFPTDAFGQIEIPYSNEDGSLLTETSGSTSPRDLIVTTANGHINLPPVAIRSLGVVGPSWELDPSFSWSVRKPYEVGEEIVIPAIADYTKDGLGVFPYSGRIIFENISGGEIVNFRHDFGTPGKIGTYGGNGTEQWEVILINLGDTQGDATGTAIVEYYRDTKDGLYIKPVINERLADFIKSTGVISVNPVFGAQEGLFKVLTTTSFRVELHLWAVVTSQGNKFVEVPLQDINATTLGVSAAVTYIYLDIINETIEHSINAPSIEVPMNLGTWLPLGNIDHNDLGTELISPNILPQVAATEGFGGKLDNLTASGQGISYNGSAYAPWSDGGAVDEIETSEGSGKRIGGSYVDYTDVADLNKSDFVINAGGKVTQIFYGYSDAGVFNLVVSSPFDGLSDNANIYWDGVSVSAVGSAKWSAQRMFYFYGTGVTVMALGNSTENDLATIKANWTTENFVTPPDLKEAVLRAVFFVKGDFADWGDTASFEILNL